MMAPPATRDLASSAARPLVVSSVLLTMTVLLIYVLIVFPRPFMFSAQKNTIQVEIPSAVVEHLKAEEDPYSLLNDTYSRHQIPLFNVPFLYKLRFKLFMPWKDGVDFGPHHNWLTEGYTIMYFTVLKTNKRLQVHSANLHVGSVHIEDDFGRNITVLEVDRGFPHVLDVHTEHELIENMNYSIHIHYTSKVVNSKRPKGLHLSKYQVGDETRFMVSTHCQTQHARTVFPCLDVPEAKAKFSAEIIHPKGTTACFNAQETTNVTEGNWTTTHFEHSPLMSTYLFAMAVSEFTYTETNWKNIRIRVYAEPSRLADTALAISILPKLIKFLEEYFAIPCPLQKLDIYEVPILHPRAMENWGLITSRPRVLLYNANTSTPSDRFYIMITLAHEITHQWFGNLVTMKWWNNLWLNEGFATFIGCKAVASFGVFDYDNYIQIAQILRADQERPVEVSRREHPTFPPDTQFTSSYVKPAAIMKMIEHIVGEESFRLGVVRFLQSFSYSNADHEDLMEALTYAHDSSSGSHLAGQPFSLNAVIETWIYQKGFPVVNLRIRDDGVVIASQCQFFVRDDVNMKNQWKIPLFVRHPVTKEPKVEWLVENETVAIDLGDDVVLDLDAAAFIRIRYDENMYGKIVKKLRSSPESIPVNSRARLVDDSFTFAEQGNLSYGIVLNIISYLANETTYPPVSALHAHLDFLYSRLNVHPKYNELQNFVIGILGPIFHRMEQHPPEPNENSGEHQLQEIVCKRVCGAGFAPCVRMATDAVRQAKDDCGINPLGGECSRIKPHMRRCVYAAVAMYGEQDLFDFMFDKYLEETDKYERDSLWVGMAASKRKHDIYKLWDNMIKENIVHVENLRDFCVEYSKYYHSINHFVTYVDENSEEIVDLVKVEMDMESLLITYIRSLSDVSQMEKLEIFLGVVEKKFPKSARNLKMSAGRVHHVAHFRELYADLIINNVTSILKTMQPPIG